MKRSSKIPASLDYDAFGRIDEYFLGAFALSRERHQEFSGKKRVSFWVAARGMGDYYTSV